MHLGLLTAEWHPQDAGGIATYCRTLAGYAARSGQRVTVVAADAGGQPDAGSHLPGVQVVTVAVAGLGPVAVAARVRDALGRLIEAGRGPDIVESAEFGGVAALISDLPSAPPLATRLHTPLALILERNEGERVYRNDSERCRLEERQVRTSTLLTSPSTWLAVEAQRLWRLPVAPLVSPNPVELVCPEPVSTKRSGPIRVLYLGRLEYRKGVLILAHAARRWLAGGASAELIIAGGDTKWRGTAMSQRVREALEPFADPPTCVLLGKLGPADVESEIQASDIVVLPSLYENFAYACLEAMVRGKPVLATRGSGFDEIIQHERTGFLVPPGDVDALADALAAYTADRDRLAEVGRRALAAVNSFAPECAAARLCETYAAWARPSARAYHGRPADTKPV